MSSRATASAGRGPMRLPPTAPARIAALKTARLRKRMDIPPKGSESTVELLPAGGEQFTLTAEPRASKRLPGGAAPLIIRQSNEQAKMYFVMTKWARRVCCDQG